MSTHAGQTQEKRSQEGSHQAQKMPSGSESTFQFVDNRPETVRILDLQEIANNSPQVNRLGAFQEMGNNSLRVARFAQFQAIADRSQRGGSYPDTGGREVVQKTKLGKTQQATKGRIYLYNDKSLVKVLAAQTKKGARAYATVTRVWPEKGGGGEFEVPSTQLDDGKENERFAILFKEFQEANEQAKAKKREKEKAETEHRKKMDSEPTIQWGRKSRKILNDISQLISDYVNDKTSTSGQGGVEEGVNKLDETELACVRSYGETVDSKDPYIAIKQLDNGHYAVMSNKGGILIFNSNAEYKRKGEKAVKGEGRSVHCEAALNDVYDGPSTRHEPAKATKVEGGHATGGAVSQNCLLCSLDARRRGYAYDPHTNPPEAWSYKVTDYRTRLFPRKLKEKMVRLITSIVADGIRVKIPGLESCKYRSDQQIVDTLRTIFNVSQEAIAGNYT